MSHGSVVGDQFSLVGGSVEDLSAGRWSVGRWRTCRWDGGRLSVVRGLTVVVGFVIRRKVHAEGKKKKKESSNEPWQSLHSKTWPILSNIMAHLIGSGEE